MMDNLPLPPEQLRFNVSNSRDPDEFLAVGKRCLDDLEIGLGGAGSSLSACKRILDWGCGCGRTLRWLHGYTSNCELYGCDVDATAIKWCRDNLKGMQFEITGSHPPLPYGDRFFDLVFGVSVFTHLNAEFQRRWLLELNRITSLDGYLLLSVMGENIANTLSDDLKAQFYRDGFLFVHSPVWEGIHAEWYADAYQSEKYVRDNFSEHFEIISYTSAGMNGHQDLVVMRKRL